MNAKSGMLVRVYSDGGNATNGGLTSKHKSFVLLGVEGPFEANDETPALKLVKRVIGGQEYLHAEPTDKDRPLNMAGPMFGGNFVFTSDTRFNEVSRQPIPVHDRFETQEEVNDNSN